MTHFHIIKTHKNIFNLINYSQFIKILNNFGIKTSKMPLIQRN